MPEPYGVLIVDPSPTMQRILQHMIANAPGLQVTSVVSSVHEADAARTSLNPAVILMDVALVCRENLPHLVAFFTECTVPVLLAGDHDRLACGNQRLIFRLVHKRKCQLVRRPAGPWMPDYKQEAQHLLDTLHSLADQPMGSSPATHKEPDGCR